MLQFLAVIGLLIYGAAASDVPIKTIIDVLSSRTEFSTLVGLLQHHDLVTLINQSYNSTLLAPINSAFATFDADAITRDQLLYHFLNATVIFDDSSDRLNVLLPSYLKKKHENVQVHIKGETVNQGPSRVVEENLCASSQRGVVHAVSEVISPPQDLCSSLFYHDKLAVFSQMASIEGACSKLQSNVTLFAPANSAFGVFKEIELRYLTSKHAQRDRDIILQRHTAQGLLRPQDLPCDITMLDGTELTVENARLDISSAMGDFHGAPETWLVSKTGVLNIYSELFTKGPLVNFTPEKYVLALEGHTFAREVALYGYSWLLDGTYTEPLTIFVPQSEDPTASSVGVQSNYKFRADSVLYQFVKENLYAGDEECEFLVDSAMTLKGSRRPQRVHVTRHSSGTLFVNWQPIVSEPYEIGNATIYVVPGEIPAPPTFSMAIGPIFMSSHSLNFLDQLGLVNLPLSNSWTLLLPSREAWEQEKLLMAYMSSHPVVLRDFFNQMIFKTPVYSDSGAVPVRLLSGDKVKVEISESSPEGPTVNISGQAMTASNLDILFDNGVAHIVDEVQLPPTVEISSRDLIEAGGRQDFIDLLEENGFGYVFDPHENYTIIVPDVEALTAANYTGDNPLLHTLLKLHLIPGNHSQEMFAGKPLLTVADEEVAMHWVSSNTLAISLVSGFGQSVYVTQWAASRGENSLGSSVFFIESFISPEWVHSPFLRPPFRMKTHTLLLLGIIVGLVLMSLFLLAMVYLFTGTKGFDDEDQTPLLQEPSDDDSEYQDRSDPEQPAQPIRTAAVSEDRQFGNHLNLP